MPALLCTLPDTPSKPHRAKDVLRWLGCYDRFPLVVLLVMGNLVLLALLPDVIWWLQIRGTRVFFWLQGIALGQMIWLGLWFSFSRIPLILRAAVAVGVLLLLNVLILMRPYYSPVFLGHFFFQSNAVCLAWVLSVYACVLPIRRLRGIVLGIPFKEKGPEKRRQFLLRDVALWTALFLAPLALLRAVFPNDLFPILANFFAMFVLLELLLGIPLFVAGLCGQQSWLAVPLAFGYMLLAAWLLGEVFYRFGNFGSGPYPDFREFANLLMPAAGMVSLNNIILQLMGLRISSDHYRPGSR
jgi:hypothetical protein